MTIVVPGGGGGGGTVDSVVAGDNVTVDDTDPSNPVVSAQGVVESVVAGTNIAVDDTDPANPIVSAADGSGIVESVVAGTNVTVDDTDPLNPVVSATGGGGVESVVAGTGISVDDGDPANPVVSTDGAAVVQGTITNISSDSSVLLAAGTTTDIDMSVASPPDWLNGSGFISKPGLYALQCKFTIATPFTTPGLVISVYFDGAGVVYQTTIPVDSLSTDNNQGNVQVVVALDHDDVSFIPEASVTVPMDATGEVNATLGVWQLAAA